MRKLGILPSGWLGPIASTDDVDPRPFLIEGVRVRFDPVGRKAVREARTACAAALKETGDMLAASDALTIEMLRHGIVEWEGVGDAEGKIAPVDPENVAMFLADTDLVEAAEAVYVTPWLTRDAEKNASAASSNGTSEAETAASDIASGSANGEKTAGARPSRTPTRKKPARDVPTSPTSRGSKKAKVSSKS